MVCHRHRDGDEDDVPGQLPRGADEIIQESFAERLSAGDYASLITPGLRDALRQAAADAGLEAEIGALRVALLRLLQEERDPSRMATGIARVAGVALQAFRQQQAGRAAATELQLLVVERLLTIEAEQDAGQAQEAAFAVRGGGDDHDVE